MSANGQTKREAIDWELRQEALMRLRICAPVVAVSLTVGVVVSPLIGVPISGGVLLVNALSLVLIMSGKTNDRETQAMVDEGLAAGHLLKPFTRRALLEAVDAALPPDSTETPAFDPHDRSLD